MMAHKSRLARLVLAIFVVCCLLGSMLATAGNRAPAGQVCPVGSYVIGFDSKSNIICTGSCGNGVLNPGETCDDGNTDNGDSCSAICQSEGVGSAGADEEIAAETTSTAPVIIPSNPKLIISDVEPSAVVFGTSEVTITVSGTGFHSESVIIFDGSKYPAAVNQAGTQLEATIVTGNLGIGPYALTVSNGSGMKTTLKKAVEIF